MISTELTRIKNAKAALRGAINAKGGTLTDELIDDYAAAVTALEEGGIDTSDATAVQGEILSGKTAYIASGKTTGSMANVGAQTVDISAKDTEVTPTQGYHNGSGKVKIATAEQDKIITGNIKSGVTILGVSGATNVIDTTNATDSAVNADILSGKKAFVNGASRTGSMANRGAVTGTISTKAGTYTVQAGYHNGSGSVAIASAEQAKIIAGNIKSGVTILGQAGSYTGSSWQNASGAVNSDSNGSVTISSLAFTPKICALFYEDATEEGHFCYLEYIGGHWLMSGVFGWRGIVDEDVSVTSGSITIDYITDGVYEVSYSVWG